jgi:serine/threonine protein kinase
VFYIVKKTLRIEANSANDPKPFEMRVLALLPKCNRIVHALACVASDDPQLGIALFRFYPSGDLADWKKGEFDNKNHKPVPESYIWRFFVQMTQALAFIHNFIGPKKEERHCILHRDIKPTNILVVKNGTTYPSFRLHDFGCASVWQEDKEKQASYCGTFDWQPPENPFINTVAADVWALGACVHFLATGQKPIMNTEESRALCLQRVEQSMTTMGECSSPNRYYAASVPRRVLPINIDAEEQLQRGIAGLDAYNRQYSDELDGWMRRCLQERSENRPSTLELLRDVSVVAQKLLKCMGGVAALADMEVKF